MREGGRETSQELAVVEGGLCWVIYTTSLSPLPLMGARRPQTRYCLGLSLGPPSHPGPKRPLEESSNNHGKEGSGYIVHGS